MITDSVLNILYNLLDGLFGLLPDMPQNNVAHNLGAVVGEFNYVLPISEFMGFVPVIAAVMAGFLIWRLVRAFLPGG
jgi:hypothetical protein